MATTASPICYTEASSRRMPRRSWKKFSANCVFPDKPAIWQRYPPPNQLSACFDGAGSMLCFTSARKFAFPSKASATALITSRVGLET